MTTILVLIFLFDFIDCQQILKTYEYQSEYNGKMCQSSEQMFMFDVISDVTCTYKCLRNEDCVGVFYSETKNLCTGCGQIHSDNLIETTGDTKYYYRPNINCEDTDSWYQNDGSYYKVFESPVEYAEAKNVCRSHCSSLLRIDSQPEMEYINGLVQDVSLGWIFIGLEYDLDDSVWKWGDDQTVPSYANWNSGEPNGAPGELCVVAVPFHQCKWFDVSCSPYAFICEK